MRGRFPNAGRIGAAIGLPTGLFGLGLPALFMQEFQYGKTTSMTTKEVVATLAICGLLGLGGGYLAGRTVNTIATNFFRKTSVDAEKSLEYTAKEIGKPKI